VKRGAEGRPAERLRHHYEVEREIAGRLRAARDRGERARILGGMYAELFARVPDHPRLTARRDPAAERRTVERLLRLLRPHLGRETEYVEFGAGSCALALAVCAHARRVRVVEIADQIGSEVARPVNFELVLTDGDRVPLPDGCADLVFSEQFVEHLHPDDAEHHFALVMRLLRPGGRYVLRTPERWTGPHDISRWFSETPEGFHLCEWSYRELVLLGRRIGFRRQQAVWQARDVCLRWPLAVALGVESVVARWPRPLRLGLGRRLVPMVTLVLEK
jgi:SAM-dependent methyltransferase